MYWKKENRQRSWNLGGMSNFRNPLNLLKYPGTQQVYLPKFAKGDLERLLWWGFFPVLCVCWGWVLWFWGIFLFLFLIGFLPFFLSLFCFSNLKNAWKTFLLLFFCFAYFVFTVGLFTLEKQISNLLFFTLTCKNTSGYLGAEHDRTSLAARLILKLFLSCSSSLPSQQCWGNWSLG